MSVAAPPSPTTTACPACGFGVPVETLSPSREIPCPQCRAVLSGEFFPAFSRPAPAAPSFAEHAADGESVCFFHPENRAALSCDRCGRFLCTVCDMPLGARHLCPTCLSSGLTGDRLEELVFGRYLWADSALLLGVLPLLASLFIWPALVVTGSAAIFCALYGWKKPGSLPRGRRRWAAVLGLILGVLQVGGWLAVVLLIAHSPVWSRLFQ